MHEINLYLGVFRGQVSENLLQEFLLLLDDLDFFDDEILGHGQLDVAGRELEVLEDVVEEMILGELESNHLVLELN